jgi:hypothetical protein
MTHLEGIGGFGDVRRAERGAWLFDRIVATGSLVLRKVGGDRAGEMAAHRFVDSPAVTAGEIIETLGTRTGERCQGRRIIAVQDTTEINFSGRARARRGLGPAGDGKTPGFFMHAVVAVDRDDEAVVGLLDAAIWTRRAVTRVARRKRRLADKESQRWLTATQVVAERAGGAGQVIAVGDRESDIFALFARRPASVELVVRAAQDRALADGVRLFAQPAGWPVLGEREVKVGSRGPGDPGRTAKLSLRAGPIRVARPRNGADPNDAEYLDLSLVEAREEAPPPGPEAVHWRLITTLPAADLQAAEEIVQIYRLRWRIEQVFRATKNDGLGLPDVQMHDAARLLKIAALAIGAAVRTIHWWTHAMAASGRRAMSPMPIRWRRPRRLVRRWRVRRSGSKTRIRRIPYRGCPGSSPGLAAGTATTSRPDPKRCAPVGIGWQRWLPATTSPRV